MTGSPTPPAADRAAGSEAAAGQRFAIAIGLLGLAGLAVTAPAQTPPAAPAITRTMVAGTKLASLDNTPLYFRAVSVSIPPGRGAGIFRVTQTAHLSRQVRFARDSPLVGEGFEPSVPR